MCWCGCVVTLIIGLFFAKVCNLFFFFFIYSSYAVIITGFLLLFKHVILIDGLFQNKFPF